MKSPGYTQKRITSVMYRNITIKPNDQIVIGCMIVSYMRMRATTINFILFYLFI